ncbi:MAG: hypothetical protein D6675_10445 [Gemmatimonadetes bacterium]|nr:MAG: hypothetical protein D6675_10445 [Gemmatimonadota bacterium]
MSRVANVEIGHCCLEKGVHLRLRLDQPLDLDRLDSQRVTNKYVVEHAGAGFFRFYWDDQILITGIFGAMEVTVTFHYLLKMDAIRALEALFPNFGEQYQQQVQQLL